MIELGQLEAKHESFAERGVRIVVISDDEPGDAQKTKDQFPHLIVVSDPYQSVARAVDAIHKGQKQGGGDTNAPTTFLVDSGKVRWYFRPTSFLARLTPEELLNEVNKTWK